MPRYVKPCMGRPLRMACRRSAGEEFIDWLVRRNLFVIALDHRRRWFRYHHLFQELLQERLRNALSSEEIGDLYAKACRWYEEAGLIDEAIGYALNGGDALGAADIVARHWRIEVNNDRWYVVKRWLTLLPEGSVNQRPGLLLAQAWTEYFQSQMVRIGSIIEKVESLTDEQTVQPEISQDLDFFRGCLEYWSGNGETSLQLLEGTLTELPARPRIIEGNYAIYFGLAHHMCGHADLAVQALTDLLRAVDPVAERFASQILGGLIFVHLLSGALHSAAAQARRLQLLAQKVGMHNTDAWVSYFHGYVAIQTLQLEQAQYHFTMAVDKRYVFEPEAAIDSFVGLALIQQLKGQPDDAQETLDRLLEFAEIIHQPNLLTIVDSCIARLALLRGDLPTAFRWARSFNEPPESAGLFMWLEAPVITQARVLIAFGTENSLLQASELLAAIRHASEANYYTCQVIEVAILQAMVLEKQGRLPEALESLEQALALSEPGGFIRPFTELGQPMSALLVRLRSAVVGDNLATYIDRILASFPAQDTTSAACDQSPLIEPLTDRELQVLRLLATELSIDEIASYLVVSPGTVRTHTRSIYSKLDVHRRSAAVFRGQELDLI